ncbi:MAG TPA: hypothetical protein VKA43_03065 [Gammaproteobacteria bacterium]|nr:hypothetical protein [Gammaproteobacteria bacterium]
MSWEKNNRAHACLCVFEKWHHKKRDVPFVATGEWTTDFLIKSAAGESAAMRSKKARAHAELLDGAFSGLYRAKYETNFDRDTAIEQMLAVLKNKTMKLKDLGDPVDQAYQFIGEL